MEFFLILSNNFQSLAKSQQLDFINHELDKSIDLDFIE